MENINYISVAEKFWVRWNKGLISFGYDELPEDIHFSVSFHPDLDKVNLHLTRNVDNENDKPQIKIIEIKKSTLITATTYLDYFLFDTLLKPIDVKGIIGKYGNDLKYIPLSKLDIEDNRAFFENQLMSKMKGHAILKRKKVKFKKTAVGQISSLLGSYRMIKWVEKNTRKFRPNTVTGFEFGFLLTKKFSCPVIHLGGQWYNLNNNIEFDEIISRLLDINTYTEIKKYVEKSIIDIQKCNCYADSFKFEDVFFLE